MPKGQKPYLRRDKVPLLPAPGFSESVMGPVPKTAPSAPQTKTVAETKQLVEALRARPMARQFQLYQQEVAAGIAPEMTYEEWMSSQGK